MARFKLAMVTLVLSGTLLHCERKSSEPSGAEPAPQSNTGPAEGMTPAAGTTAPGESRTRGGAQALTEEQIFKVMDLANMAEVEEGKVAKSKAQNARVKAFAAMMVEDHGKAREKGVELSSKLDMKPSESPLATELKADSEKALSTLQSATGAEFDRKYIDAQVDEHKKVIATIDEKLLTNAKSPELKALLQEMRGKVQAHLTEAQQIQTELARSGSL